jgi:hypothetical protein
MESSAGPTLRLPTVTQPLCGVGDELRFHAHNDIIGFKQNVNAGRMRPASLP